MGRADHILAFDVAKKHDFSSLELFRVTDAAREDGAEAATYLDWVRSSKLKDAPYTELGAMVRDALASSALAGRCDLLVDATGVGEAVVDILRDEGLDPIPIVFTAGNKVSMASSAHQDSRFGQNGQKGLRRVSELRVPKQDMIHASQIVLQQGRLRILPRCGDAGGIRRQLSAFVGRVNERGGLSAEASRDSVHDDHVAAFLMASWWWTQMMGARRPGWRPGGGENDGNEARAYSPMRWAAQGRI